MVRANRDRYLNFLVLKYFSIAKRERGKNTIAIERVPYAIQTTMNPQNIKVILLTSDPILLTPISLINKYIKTPAKKGCKSIRILHAPIKGKIIYSRDKKLRIENLPQEDIQKNYKDSIMATGLYEMYLWLVFSKDISAYAHRA